MSYGVTVDDVLVVGKALISIVGVVLPIILSLL